MLHGCYTGMTMLLIPLSVLSVISLSPRTPVLGITKIPIDCAIRMWADVVTGRCRACCKPIALSGKNKKRNFMDHVLKHVSLTVGGLCYLTGCAEHVIPHCRNFHGQKALHGPNTFLGRFEVHPDILEPFIAFSRDRGMTDEQEIFTTTSALGDNGVGCLFSSHHVLSIVLVFISFIKTSILFHFYVFVSLIVNMLQIAIWYQTR